MSRTSKPAGPVAHLERDALDAALFRFLQSVARGNPEPSLPIVTSGRELARLYVAPAPALVEALRHAVDAFLIDVEPDPAERGTLTLPGCTLGLALAVHNSAGGATEAAREFTEALVATLPPARGLGAIVAYHAVLRPLEVVMARSRETPRDVRRALVARSPLTALVMLDRLMPPALETLAAELLPGHVRPRVESDVRDPAARDREWIDAVTTALADARLARWVRNRWLAMPETRQACRNLGLLLESLRRADDLRWRELIFDYYAADRCFGIGIGGIIGIIEKLLLASGDTSHAIRLNRWGNEYLLKFLALTETVLTDRRELARPGVREQMQRLQPLLHLTTIGAARRVSFGSVSFGAQGESR